MSHVKMLLAGGVMALSIVVAIGCSGTPTTAAKRAMPGTPGSFGGGEVGRFVVAQTGADGITILDTATGELYRATPNDVKPYSARPRGDRIIDSIKDSKDERLKDAKPIFKDEKPRFKDENSKDKPKDDFKKDEFKKEEIKQKSTAEKAVDNAKEALIKAEVVLEVAILKAQDFPDNPVLKTTVEKGKKTFEEAKVALKKAEDELKKALDDLRK